MTESNKKLSAFLGSILLAVSVFSALAPALILAFPNSASASLNEDGNTKELRAQENAAKKAASLLQTTSDQNYDWCWLDVSCFILTAGNRVLDYIGFLLVPLAQGFMNTMLDYNFVAFENGPAGKVFMTNVELGWNIVRYTMNMFFILILLWMAIATIFDFEQFSARQLLLRLIIAALLINFSLPIGRFMVNLTNAIGKPFKNELNRDGGVASAIATISDTRQLTLAVQNKYPTLTPKSAQQIVTTTKTKTRGMTAEQCDRAIRLNPGTLSPADRAECDLLVTDTQIRAALNVLAGTPQGQTQLLAGALVAKIFVIPISIFVLMAGGVLLLIRLISLLFLLIFGPFAFAALILPFTRQYWTQWWETLLKWGLFLPAFLFLFMLSVLMIRGLAGAVTQIVVSDNKDIPSIAAMLVTYFLGVGMMIGSLMVAQKLGIQGAGAVMGVGKKLSGAVGGYAKDRGWKYGGRVAEQAAKVPILRSLPGVRQALTATMAKGGAVEKKDIGFYSRLGDKQLASVLDGMRAGKGEAIWRSLSAQRQRQSGNNELGALAKKQGWVKEEGALAKTPDEKKSQRDLAVSREIAPVLQGIIQTLPPAVQDAIRNGVAEAIRDAPMEANPDEMASAIESAARNVARANDREGGFDMEFNRTGGKEQIVKAVTVAQEGARATETRVRPTSGGGGTAADRLAQAAQELAEEQGALRSEIDALKEKK